MINICSEQKNSPGRGKLTRLLKLWLPAIGWATLIYCLSGIPRLESGFEYDYILRKIAHVTEYFILTYFTRRACQGSFNFGSERLFIYPATLSFLYAVSDEIHQSFVPGRTCAVGDVLIDTVGILGFYLIGSIIKRN
jgi:hypothetical protein